MSLASDSYLLRIPPVTVRIRTHLRSVKDHFAFFYPNEAFDSPDVFVDLDIAIQPGKGIRRFWRPQARFFLDENEPFLPLPLDQAPPLFEWGLNWCMAHRPLGYLAIHAAIVAKGNEALLLPGFPGAGKSTLCAALVFLDHWRLLSDELALLDPDSGNLSPHPRPINLKNHSIDIVSGFPGTRVGPRYLDTRKGTIALAAPPEDSICLAEQPARCRWVVFPTFVPEGDGWCEEISRAESFALIAEQSFNKDRMGETGFKALCRMLAEADCYQIGYRSTEEALQLIENIRTGSLP
jgi:HprK-related kinase A